jgi:hypothetical protein
MDNTIGSLVLHLNMSTLQRPLLHLYVSTLQRPLLHLSVRVYTHQGPELHLQSHLLWLTRGRACSNSPQRGHLRGRPVIQIKSPVMRMLPAEPEFVNLLRSPGIYYQPCGSVRQPYLSYRPVRLHRLAESTPWDRFLVSLNVYKFGLRRRQNYTVGTMTMFYVKIVLMQSLFISQMEMYILTYTKLWKYKN